MNFLEELLHQFYLNLSNGCEQHWIGAKSKCYKTLLQRNTFFKAADMKYSVKNVKNSIIRISVCS